VIQVVGREPKPDRKRAGAAQSLELAALKWQAAALRGQIRAEGLARPARIRPPTARLTQIWPPIQLEGRLCWALFIFAATMPIMNSNEQGGSIDGISVSSSSLKPKKRILSRASCAAHMRRRRRRRHNQRGAACLACDEYEMSWQRLHKPTHCSPPANPKGQPSGPLSDWLTGAGQIMSTRKGDEAKNWAPDVYLAGQPLPAAAGGRPADNWHAGRR